MNVAGQARRRRRPSSQVTNVKLSKEGPIHDVQWSPKGDEFIAVFGYSPSKAVIFNTKCEEVYNFGEAPRNTVRRCVARTRPTADPSGCRRRRRRARPRSASGSPPPHPTSALSSGAVVAARAVPHHRRLRQPVGRALVLGPQDVQVPRHRGRPHERQLRMVARFQVFPHRDPLSAAARRQRLPHLELQRQPACTIERTPQRSPPTTHVSPLTTSVPLSLQATCFTRRRSRSCPWRSGGRSRPTASPRRPTPTSRRSWRR